MQRLEVSGVVRLIYRSLGGKGLRILKFTNHFLQHTVEHKRSIYFIDDILIKTIHSHELCFHLMCILF